MILTSGTVQSIKDVTCQRLEAGGFISGEVGAATAAAMFQCAKATKAARGVGEATARVQDGRRGVAWLLEEASKKCWCIDGKMS